MATRPQNDPEGIEIKRLRDFVKFKHRRVLEIGCGEGRLTWRYAAAARSVLGIDPDPERVSVAGRDCPPGLRPTTHFVVAQSEELPCPPRSFDLAILAWSL